MTHRGPPTHVTDPLRIMALLDHDEMNVLAEMYERWALTEEGITPDQRTRLIQMSADYEAIAAYCGPDWTASGDGEGDNALSVLAKAELGARASIA